MSKRALRRHHRARMIAHAEKIQRRWWGLHEPTPEELRQAAVRLADNLAWCSCYSCGNPRRHFGFTVFGHNFEALTRQEIRHLLDFHEQMDYTEKL